MFLAKHMCCLLRFKMDIFQQFSQFSQFGVTFLVDFQLKMKRFVNISTLKIKLTIFGGFYYFLFCAPLNVFCRICHFFVTKCRFTPYGFKLKGTYREVVVCTWNVQTYTESIRMPSIDHTWFPAPPSASSRRSCS